MPTSTATRPRRARAAGLGTTAGRVHPHAQRVLRGASTTIVGLRRHASLARRGSTVAAAHCRVWTASQGRPIWTATRPRSAARVGWGTSRMRALRCAHSAARARTITTAKPRPSAWRAVSAHTRRRVRLGARAASRARSGSTTLTAGRRPSASSVRWVASRTAQVAHSAVRVRPAPTRATLRRHLASHVGWDGMWRRSGTTNRRTASRVSQARMYRHGAAARHRTASSARWGDTRRRRVAAQHRTVTTVRTASIKARRA